MDKFYKEAEAEIKRCDENKDTSIFLAKNDQGEKEAQALLDRYRTHRLQN